jgi:glucose repression regulatory protein TUP1
MPASYSTTAPGVAQPQDPTQHDLSISSVGRTTVQTGAQQNFALQAQQFQTQIYHRYHIPESQWLALQEPSAPAQQALFQVNSPPACSAPGGHGSQPAQCLAAHGIFGLSKPSTVPFPDQFGAQQVINQSGCPNSRPPPFIYAFTEQEIGSLPADQTKVGDGWFVHYNPQLPRVIDVSLLHTFRHESVVGCVRFSPDGKYVATGSNGTVQMFDALSGHLLGVLRIDSTSNPPGDMYILCVGFSPNGKHLATGSEDGLVRVRWIQ